MLSFLKTGKLGGDSGSKEKSTSQTKKSKVPQPWVEKYRPKTVNDIVEQKDAVEVMKKCLNGADLPNLLFYGPPGTGKTSTILAAARQLFGDIYRERILELNASDERGIQIIRDKVKVFAQLTASSIRPDGKPCPPFKIIILDEADSMTHAAQAALRRTIERETKTTRFCLVCNYVSRIIQPITSRCTKFRFRPLGEEKVRERLELICKEENITCSAEAVQTLIETSGGDLRRSITSLQSCSHLKGADSEITAEDVHEVAAIIPVHWPTRFLDMCKLNNYDKITEYVEEFLLEAYSVQQLVLQLLDMVVFHAELSDTQKAIICERLSQCTFRLQDGGNEYINLLDLCCITTKAMQMN